MKYFALRFVVASALLLGAAHAAPVVGTDNVEAMKESKRVAIERFGVEFYSQLFGEGRSGKNTARMTANLEGIGEATRQAITQQAYKDTVQALQKAGYEVLDTEQLRAQPVFQALDAKYGKPAPLVVEDEKMMQGGKQVSRIYAPEGMKAYFQSGTARGDFAQRTESQNQGIGAQQGELAKALGATLLDVHVLASFGKVSATKNGGLRIFAGLGAKAGIEAQPLLYEEETQIQIVNSQGARTFGMSHRMGHTGAVYLKEPLLAGTNIFSMRDTQPEADKDKQSAMNLLTGLLSGTSERAGSSEVKAESEEAYRATYQALIREALESMVAALGSAP
ncbi:MAG: hypothetical protein HXX19_13780 [Rhodoferax sp.]|nr:hypothetical protein [Rhodoferax sp.]